MTPTEERFIQWMKIVLGVFTLGLALRGADWVSNVFVLKLDKIIELLEQIIAK